MNGDLLRAGVSFDIDKLNGYRLQCERGYTEVPGIYFEKGRTEL